MYIDIRKLRRFVINLMLRWSAVKIEDPKLVEEIFSLLYRQYNLGNEVSVYALYGNGSKDDLVRSSRFSCV